MILTQFIGSLDIESLQEYLSFRLINRIRTDVMLVANLMHYYAEAVWLSGDLDGDGAMDPRARAVGHQLGLPTEADQVEACPRCGGTVRGIVAHYPG